MPIPTVAVDAPPPAPAGPPLADEKPVVLMRREFPGGSALERLVEPSGELVVHVVNPQGTVLSCERVGSLYALPLVEQTFAAGGEAVHVARDESGALVRYVVQADGEPRGVTVLAQGQFR